MKKCSKCGELFVQKKTGRLRMALKKPKGEKIAWVCPRCARELMK